MIQCKVVGFKPEIDSITYQFDYGYRLPEGAIPSHMDLFTYGKPGMRTAGPTPYEVDIKEHSYVHVSLYYKKLERFWWFWTRWQYYYVSKSFVTPFINEIRPYPVSNLQHEIKEVVA